MHLSGDPRRWRERHKRPSVGRPGRLRRTSPPGIGKDLEKNGNIFDICLQLLIFIYIYMCVCVFVFMSHLFISMMLCDNLMDGRTWKLAWNNLKT